MLNVFLNSGRERPILNGHPWIFSGAIESVEGPTEAVGVADVFDCKENWLARGLYNPKSQIRVRVLTWQKEAIDRDFFARRISQAHAFRQRYLSDATDAYRVVNAEGDLLPGLIVDRYANFLVSQFFSAGIALFKDAIVSTLSAIDSVKGIFERSDGRVGDEEGLEPSVGVLSGEAPPEQITITESGFKFLVDVRRGQKTGFFLDQRDNRAFLSTVVRDQTVLNCFSYSGAFSVYAFGAGAREVVSLDSSRPALELAEQNLALNGFAEAPGELLKGDAFAYLKETDRQFDLIVLDPPSLAHKRSDVMAATGGYKFLNLHALKHLKPGGMLLTFSCSQHLSTDLFQKVVFGAAVDATRKVTIVKRLGHPIDHPISLHHPEGEYLKGLALRVLD
ncbi:MAG TPA: class I SAM-dependent rRNA methyltransferase [Candidatus Binatia bacterium]|jgi:23S rRNA (cytosine1962-C5)-methyltransferase|nr:class I SAM-dependent rRNA methyltransferase [Candidatus Binatia bacterium]